MARLESFYETEQSGSADFELIRGKPDERGGFVSEWTYHLVSKGGVLAVVQGLHAEATTVRFSQLRDLGWESGFELTLTRSSTADGMSFLFTPSFETISSVAATTVPAASGRGRNAFNVRIVTLGEHPPATSFSEGLVYEVRSYKAGRGVYDMSGQVVLACSGPWRDSDYSRRVDKSFFAHTKDSAVLNEALIAGMLDVVRHGSI